MIFLNGLKRIEGFLTRIADSISPEEEYSRESDTGTNVTAAQSRPSRSVPPSRTGPITSSTRNVLHQFSDVNVVAGSSLEDECHQEEGVSNKNTGHHHPHPLKENFPKMLECLQDEVSKIKHTQGIIPPIPYDVRQDLMMALRQEMRAQQIFVDATKAMERLKLKTQQKHEDSTDANANNNALDEATKEWEHMQVVCDQAQEELLQIASRVLTICHETIHQKMNSNGYSSEHKGEAQTRTRQEMEMIILQSAIFAKAQSSLAAIYKDCVVAQQLYALLQNPHLMREIIISGGPGPNGEDYLNFLRIYRQILECRKAKTNKITSHQTNNHTDITVSTSSKNISADLHPNRYHSILDRLALAVALEHAQPIFIFDTKVKIDPVQRYLHYERAFLNDELDRDAFGVANSSPSETRDDLALLSTWELRMVVDCDASHEEMQWLRTMLGNYRPDHILLDDASWRYCRIVRSDVEYKRPVWKDGSARTYKQLISGGGMCGPRAWFGRLACKAFGIPTWGCRQPGHAAMSRWTPSGHWVIRLGGNNWKKSWWGERNGVHFQWETLARLWDRSNDHQHHQNDPSSSTSSPNIHDDEHFLNNYQKKVIWLQCLALIMEEHQIGSQQQNRYLQRPVEKNIWTELVQLQKRLLAKTSPPPLDVGRETCHSHIHMNSAKEGVRSIPGRDYVQKKVNEEYIQIPSAPCTKIPQRTGQIIIMNSLDGGKQIHIRNGATIEYDIVPNQESNAQHYLFRARVATVHSQCEEIPLQLTIHHSNDGRGSCEDHTIDIPYTGGKWMDTKPISVQLQLYEGVKGAKFRFTCPQGLRFSMKSFTLTPMQ